MYPINIIDNIIFLNFWISNVNVAELYYNLNKITNNYNELPVVPYTNIDYYLEFRKIKIIFYYNVYPNSGQPIPVNDHNIIIEILANLYNDYFIVTCNNKHLESCENVARNIHYALNYDYIITFDIGVCLYILNNDTHFYNGVQDVLNIYNLFIFLKFYPFYLIKSKNKYIYIYLYKNKNYYY